MQFLAFLVSFMRDGELVVDQRIVEAALSTQQREWSATKVFLNTIDQALHAPSHGSSILVMRPDLLREPGTQRRLALVQDGRRGVWQCVWIDHPTSPAHPCPVQWR